MRMEGRYYYYVISYCKLSLEVMVASPLDLVSFSLTQNFTRNFISFPDFLDRGPFLEKERKISLTFYREVWQQNEQLACPEKNHGQ